MPRHRSRSAALATFLFLIMALPARAQVPFAPAPGQLPVTGAGPDAWVVRGPARPGAFIDAIGRKAVWMGTETGTLEAWIWPYKVLHGLELAVRTGEVGGEVDLTSIARNVEIRPYGVQIDYVHSRFRVRQTLLAASEDPVLAMLLEVDTSEDLTLIVSFLPDLMPMWPAGMGGQFASYYEELPGFMITESRRRVNAVIGSPDAARGSAAPAHQLPGANAFEIPVSTERASEGPIIVLCTGGQESLSTATGRFRGFLERGTGLLEERKRAWASGRTRVDLDLPRPRLREAYRWAVESLADGLQYTPELGTGIVAGFGPTGEGYRPGFSWYFGGDSSINAAGMVAAGLGWAYEEHFPFMARFQREDGKMAHEVTRSAPFIDWFEDWPFAYIHGDTTPWYIVAFARYHRWTGDDRLLDELWPSLMKAYEFGEWADQDGDGLMDNSRAGLGASEVGSLRQGLKTGIYLATLWTRALEDLAYLAEQRGDAAQARTFRSEHEAARARLSELFVDRDRDLLNFGIATGGAPKREEAAWLAFPMVFGLLEGAAVENTLDLLASSGITTDWGTRMLSVSSAYYDPVGYNNGAVWPFLTGYVSLAEYASGRRHAAYQHLLQSAATTWVDARGRHPEVMSGDRFTALETSVPHQLFSAHALPAGLIPGLFGLEMDLAEGRIAVRPQLPGGWERAALRGYPMPDGSQLDLTVHRRYGETNVMYTLEVSGPEGLEVTFAPRPLPLEGYSGEGRTAEVGSEGSVQIGIGARPGTDLVIDDLRGGEIREGDPPAGLRIVRYQEVGPEQVELVAEGRAGLTYRLPLEGRRMSLQDAGPGEATLEEEAGRQVLVLPFTPGGGERAADPAYRRVRLLLAIP